MALVRIIRRHRQRLGLSLNTLADRTEELADSTKISRQMLGYFEADEYLLGLDVLGIVARALGTSSAHLLFEAQQWVARLPACCRACKYACMAHGELKWLDKRRKCTRPAPDSADLADCPPGLP
jgi:transcriptional regulator with XRE-family HTH domain